jgi:mannose-1-phosphate guanylyltransferase/phosphomannomutase
MGINAIARKMGVDLIFTRNDHLSMMEAALSGNVDLVGGTRGGFIFPKWLFAADAMFATLKILEIIATTGIKLSHVANSLPDYIRGQREVECPFGAMGRVMRILIEETASKPRDIIDGVRVYSQDSWVLIIPDTEHPIFRLIGEAKSREILESALSEYEKRICEWRES